MVEISSSQKENLKAALVILPPRDQAALSMRFGLDGDSPLSLEQVGLYFNISRGRVGQIEARALRRLEQAANTRGLAIASSAGLNGPQAEKPVEVLRPPI